MAKNETTPNPLRGHPGDQAQNRGILRSTSPLSQHHIADTFGCPCHVFLDEVAVKIFRRVNVGMAQIFGDGYDIEAVGQQNRSQRMPEGVGIDVGETEFGGKIPEPTGYGIRSGRTAIFTAKYIAGFDLILAVLQFPLTLLLLKFLKQIHGLLRQLEGTTVAGLGIAFRQSIRFAFYKRAVDADGVVLPINLFPTQSNGLAPATAGNDKKMDQSPPAQGNILQRIQNLMNHAGLKIVRGGFADFRCSGLVGGVVGDQHLLVRLRQDGMDKTMIFQNSLIGQLAFVFPDRKDILRFLVQSLGNQSGVAGGDGLTLDSGTNGDGTDSAAPGYLGAGNVVLPEPCGNVDVGGSAAILVPELRLPQGRIKAVEVLRPDLRQLEMTDVGVDTAQQLLVAFVGADPQLIFQLELQDILGVLRKGAAVVENVSVFDALLILDSVTLSGFLCLPLGHTRFGFVDDPIPDAVAVRIAPSVDGDVERVAVFGFACFNTSHSGPPFDVCRITPGVVNYRYTFIMIFEGDGQQDKSMWDDKKRGNCA